MFTKQQIEKFLFFDIETAGGAPDLRSVSPKMQKLWSHRCEYLRNNMGAKHPENVVMTDDQLFLEKSALQAEFGRIVCVSFGKVKWEEGAKPNDPPKQVQLLSYAGENEVEILEKTFKLMDGLTKTGNKLFGHTIKRFDIPYLCKRAFINNMTPAVPLQVWDKKPWEISAVDISEYWSFGAWQEGFASLDLMSTVMGLPSPKSEMEGSKVHEAFYAGDVSSISKYCQGDVLALIRQAFSLAGLNQFDESCIVSSEDKK